MAQLNFSIPDDLLKRLDAVKPDYLDRKGFLCLLLDQSLTGCDTLGKPTTGRGDEPEEVLPSKAVTTNKRTYKKKNIYTGLEQHQELIEEFWRVKKGSKSDQGWKLLNTELLKIKERYGDKVVEEQLQLAINGLWKGVSLRLYEQFKAPKGHTPAEPQNNHPASRVFTAADFDPPNPDNPLNNLFQ